MTRRIPIVSFNDEYSLNRPQIYKSLVEGVIEAMENDSDTIQICEVKNQNMYITVEKTKWKDSLDSVLQFYTDIEEYEECSKIKDLIDKL